MALITDATYKVGEVSVKQLYLGTVPLLSVSWLYKRGVCLVGGEFGDKGSSTVGNNIAGGLTFTSPGVLMSDYLYPSAGDFSFIAGRGIPAPLTRVVVRIERLISGVGQALRNEEVALVTDVLDGAQAAGVGVILVPWNFGAVWQDDGEGNALRRPVGSAEFTIADFADFWERIVTEWGDHPALVGVDLMNEPVGLLGIGGDWTSLDVVADFETDTDGWTSYDGTVEQNLTTAHSGSGSLAVQKAFATTGWSSVHISSPDISGGTGDRSAYGGTLSTWIFIPLTAPNVGWSANIATQKLDYDYAESPYVSVPRGEWTRITWDLPPDRVTDMATFIVQIGANDINGTVEIYVDDCEQGYFTNATSANGAQTWELASQAAVDAIRQTTSDLKIWVPAYGYNMHAIPAQHPDGPWIVDATQNFGYTAHHYAHSLGGDVHDYDATVASAASQGFAAGANPDALYSRELAALAALNSWLDGNQYLMGEYGISNASASATATEFAPQWLALWEALLSQYDNYAWSATAWSAGRVQSSTDDYAVYYSSSGYGGAAVDSLGSVATVIESHPSQSL